MSKLPPLAITENCSFCEQTKRDMESMETRFRRAVVVIKKRMSILETAMLVLAKPNIVNEVLDKVKENGGIGK